MNVRMLCAAVTVATLGTSVVGIASQAHAAAETTAIEAVVPTDFRTTWDRLVSELDAGDFTINATIKEQSTIRVLLQSKVPSQWVDCGSVSVESKHQALGDRNYKFLAANSVRYLVADNQSNELIDVERRTSLNALATIRLAPVRNGTQVSVDAHYVMKFRTREFGRKVVPRFLDDSLDFSSDGGGTVSEEIREGAAMKVVSIGCQPTGALERQIVSVLERPQILVAGNAAPVKPAGLVEPKSTPAPASQKITAPKKLPPQIAAATPQPRKQFRAPSPPAPVSRAQPKPRPELQLVAASKKSPPQVAVAAPQHQKLFRPPSPPAPKRTAAKSSSSSKAITPAKRGPATQVDTVWRIQLSALRSHSKAENAWNLLQQATPDLLSKLTLRVQKVESSKGTFFRVQAGPFADRQASVSLCDELKRRNQACLVVDP